MRSTRPARRLVPAAALTTAVAGLALVGLAPSASAEPPVCSDPVAGALHTVHEVAGPLGEPVHDVEGLYCSIG